MTPRAGPRWAQAWVELRSADPAAQSALQVMREHLPQGRRLRGVRRARLFEFAGPVPARARLSGLLHRSSQFYNPHKESCVVRCGARDRLPVGPTETAVVVWERDGVRSAAAERWLAREARRALEVREATVWVLAWDEALGEAERRAASQELATLRDRRHGLLANPHAEESAVYPGAPPLPVLGRSDAARVAKEDP